MPNALQTFLFQTLPYIVMATAIIGTIYRYLSRQFTYSSLSSQFLENRHHFWGTVPFHYGILAVTAGHFIGLLFPRSVLIWNAVPARLAIIEVSAFIFALLTMVGLINIVFRRVVHAKSRMVTSTLDWFVYGMLTFQVVTGLYVAIYHGWGSSWYAASAAPYLWSLFTFQPDISYVTPLPLMAQLHIIGAWTVIGIFPFSRLVHILVIPNPYLWRKWQMVRWNWDRRAIRRAD